MRLRELVGNEQLKRSVSAMDRPPHAIVISGPLGSGRHTLARLLAQAHVCTGEVHPCGTCPDCRRVAQGIHPDVRGLESFVPEAEREKDVKVSVVRDIRADAQITPNQARRKVYILDRPINLAAQNAMLKLLEEGPEYAAFLLLTENSSSLLETVRSRCVELRTGAVSVQEALAWLKERYPQREEVQLRRCAEESQGILGRCVTLLESEGAIEAPAETERWLSALLHRSELELMECAAAVQTSRMSRETAQQLYQALGQALRRALMVQSGVEPGDAQAQALARTLQERQLIQCWDLVDEVRGMGEFNVASAHSAGWLAVKLAEAVR